MTSIAMHGLQPTAKPPTKAMEPTRLTVASASRLWRSQRAAHRGRKAPTRLMSECSVDQRLATLPALGSGPGDRAARARRAVEFIRALRSYRWAGLYDVLATEIALIVWDGPGA